MPHRQLARDYAFFRSFGDDAIRKLQSKGGGRGELGGTYVPKVYRARRGDLDDDSGGSRRSVSILGTTKQARVLCRGKKTTTTVRASSISGIVGRFRRCGGNMVYNLPDHVHTKRREHDSSMHLPALGSAGVRLCSSLSVAHLPEGTMRFESISAILACAAGATRDCLHFTTFVISLTESLGTTSESVCDSALNPSSVPTFFSVSFCLCKRFKPCATLSSSRPICVRNLRVFTGLELGAMGRCALSTPNAALSPSVCFLPASAASFFLLRLRAIADLGN
ncbi:hypothetical protein K438DRAFT_1779426 [Mycena galopus ATCC 62051]|nr:hypothetical protein K438DRAFT_1779426 [Mycena galopus ATCC 62051]